MIPLNDVAVITTPKATEKIRVLKRNLIIPDMSRAANVAIKIPTFADATHTAICNGILYFVLFILRANSRHV